MRSLKKAVLIASVFIGAASLAQSNPDKVTELKGQIINLAQSYQGQGDPSGAKKQALEALISQLLAATPARTTAEKAKTAVGAWHEVWGPYHGNSESRKAGILDAANIYQVIFANNTYINVGVYTIFGHKIVDLLKGEYTLTDDKITVQFVENSFLDQTIPEGKTLVDLPAMEEAGQLKLKDFPKSGPPIGIRGELREIYSDDTLRLTYGAQEGKAGQTLYVLERVPTSN